MSGKIERLQKKLKQKETKLEKLKKDLGYNDPILDSFYGGRVGFMKKRDASKKERMIEKRMDIFKEYTNIKSEIKTLTNQIAYHRKPKKVISVQDFVVGQETTHLGIRVRVLKINTKTVRIEHIGSGYKESVKPTLLNC